MTMVEPDRKGHREAAAALRQMAVPLVPYPPVGEPC